jgi:glutathione S-transferase
LGLNNDDLPQVYKLLTSLELTVITQDQLDGLRDSALDALVAFLTDDDGKTKKYFLGGDKPTAVDACVTSIIVTPAAHKG